ncbi:MAG: hypothetical protein V4760_07795 [Bdellovibrionota bacterium]
MSRFFSSPFSKRCLAITAIVVLSLSQVSAQDLDEAIDAELDSATDLDSAADLESEPEMPKAQSDDELDDIDLEEDEGTSQAQATPTPKPAASAESEMEDELQLDEPEETKVAEPQAPAPVEEPSLEEPEAPPAIVEEPPPAIDEPPVDVSEPQAPPAIAKAPEADSDLFDAPNVAFERKLHKIVESVKPVDDFSWEEVLGDRRAELYPIQAGDTLWDISKTFFGDGFFWGKLWSQNGTIENPHDISKGFALKFIAGTEGDAPTIGVTKITAPAKSVGNGIFTRSSSDRPFYREDVEGEITQEDIDTGIAETQEIIPEPTLPPPSKRVPLLRELPYSFKLDRPDSIDQGFDLSGIKGAPAIRARESATVILPSYAVDRAPEELGKVEEIEATERIAGTGSYVYVRLNRDVNIGMRVTFAQLRPRPSGAPGPIVDVRGIGVITGMVNENKNVYRALVMTTLEPVEKGAYVLDEPPPRVTYTSEGRRAEADVQVLGSTFDNERRLMGLGSVVYLSGGAKAGLRVGDILGISSKRGTRFLDTRYPNTTVPIASVKIADVREKVATAIVLDNAEFITIGDRTSGDMPSASAKIITESAEEATNFGKGREPEIE